MMMMMMIMMMTGSSYYSKEGTNPNKLGEENLSDSLLL